MQRHKRKLLITAKAKALRSKKKKRTSPPSPQRWEEETDFGVSHAEIMRQKQKAADDKKAAEGTKAKK